MKYAGKTFTLYASQPVAIQGSDSLYTYQNTGTGTATIVGSNNAVTWTAITTVTSGDSFTGSHAYAFLMMTGSTQVSVSRGVGGGLDVSPSNPLPVVTYPTPAWASTVDSKNGYTNNVRALNTAVSAQFARQQIYNAGATDMQIFALTVWAGTAGTHVYSAYFVETHDASAAVANAKTSFRLGNTASTSIEVYHYASATAIQTTGILGSNTSASIVTPGSGLIFGAGAITIPAGKTLEIAIGTANVAFTINATVIVFPS